MKPNTILFPSSYFTIKEVDEDLQTEYEAVCSTGLFDVVLFSYDKWFNKGKLVLNRQINASVSAIYRGWMMKPEQYAAFYQQLQSQNMTLITPPSSYELFHIFPNIYPTLQVDTAKMLIYPDNMPVDLEKVKQHFSRFMVKDFVKSVKGTEFPKYFESTVTQEEFDQWMQVFFKYRGDLYTGGICIKEFLPLRQYGTHTNEYRVFYANHEIVTVSRNSGQENFAPSPPQDLLEKYRHLDSPYYTIDFAELESGDWKILEAGDGQVSGLLDQQDYEAYFRALYFAFQ